MPLAGRLPMDRVLAGPHWRQPPVAPKSITAIATDAGQLLLRLIPVTLLDT